MHEWVSGVGRYDNKIKNMNFSSKMGNINVKGSFEISCMC